MARVWITGIDISEHQGSKFDWKIVAAAGHAFAFVKASEGVGFRDPTFTRNWAEAANTGLLVGAYHYARVSYNASDDDAGIVSDAKREAAWFATQIGDLTNRLPPVLDIEWDKKAAKVPRARVVLWAKAFLLETLERTGRTPIVYTQPSFWLYRLGKTLELANYPLWQASGTDQDAPPPITGWPWTFWQWSSHLRIAGHVVDADRFRGSHEDLSRLAGMLDVPADAAVTKLEPTALPSPMSLLDRLLGWFATQTKDLRTDRARLPSGSGEDT